MPGPLVVLVCAACVACSGRVPSPPGWVRAGLLLGSECTDAGADNIMFWMGGTILTPQQGEILRTAYFVR